MLRCGVHFLADFYVTSLLAPRAFRLPPTMTVKPSNVIFNHAQVSWLRFNVRAATVFVPWPNCPDQVQYQLPRSTVTLRCAEVCIAVYGWTLVAPKVLSNRSF